MKTNRYLIIVIMSLSLFLGCKDTTEKKEKKKEESKKETVSKTPQAVMMAFQAQYPGENDPDWQIDANGNYEASFKKGGEHFRADYTPSGSWVETESSIDKKDLPDAIKERIEKEYKDYELTEIEKVSHHSKGEFYDVEFKQKGKNKDVEFRKTGEIIN